MNYTIWQLPNDEEAAIRFFQDKGIIHSNRLCSQNHPMKLTFDSNEARIRRCYVRSCCEKKGLRTKTWFEGFHLSFLNAIRFIYLWYQ
ncbi:hypothetical protein X975_01363, partial [Stegodyphus mimosarum]